MERFATCLSLIAICATASAHDLIGYLPNYRVSEQTLASANECTDLVYFGNTLGADGAIALGPNADEHLKQIKAGLKGRKRCLILCLGGWGMDEHFPAVTASEESRKRFGQALASFAETYEIDGVIEIVARAEAVDVWIVESGFLRSPPGLSNWTKVCSISGG